MALGDTPEDPEPFAHICSRAAAAAVVALSVAPDCRLLGASGGPLLTAAAVVVAAVAAAAVAAAAAAGLRLAEGFRCAYRRV